jgi:hypothetical protein
MPDRKRRQGEDPVDYAVATGRLPQRVAASYRARIADGTMTAAFIEMLAPGLPPAPGSTPAAAASGTAPAHVASSSAGGLPSASGDPVLDTLRQMFAPNTANEIYNQMYAAGTIPQLFAGGPDGGRLPVVTASGIPPTALASAPAWCRPAIAEAATLAEATELLRIASTPDGPEMLASEGPVIRPWHDFQHQVRYAAEAAGSVITEQQNETDRVAATRRQQAVNAAATPAAELSDDELYDQLFTGGVTDRVKAQRAELRRNPGLG